MQRMPILSDSDMNLFELKTRYTRNYLTFAGKNSKDFLLYISSPGVYDSPAVDVELQAIPGKNGDLIRDNNYMRPLSMTEDDMCQEAMILLWEIMMKRSYKAALGKKFSSFYFKCWEYRLNRMWRDFVSRNPVPIN